jgi:hypothetical protein
MHLIFSIYVISILLVSVFFIGTAVRDVYFSKPATDSSETLINRNSWHYRLVRKTRSRYESIPNDICRYMYMRALVGALAFTFLIVTSVSFVASFVITILGIPVLALVNYFHPFLSTSVTNSQQFNTAIIMGTSAYATTAIMFGGRAIYHLVKKYRKPSYTKPDGLLKTYYKSWRDKTCIKLTFVDTPK